MSDRPDWLDSRWQGRSGPSGGAGSGSGCGPFWIFFVFAPILVTLVYLLVADSPRTFGVLIGDAIVAVLTFTIVGAVASLLIYLGTLAVARVLKAVGVIVPGRVAPLVGVVAFHVYLGFVWYELLATGPLLQLDDPRMNHVALAYISASAVALLVLMIRHRKDH